jgi:hypothetical protein
MALGKVKFGQPKPEINSMLDFDYSQVCYCYNVAVDTHEWKMATFDA